ncbi:MAG: DUF5611 family protein [Thermoplasmata archaeon]
MQNYPMRVSHRKNLAAPALAEITKTTFGTAAIEGETVTSSFGAIARISARAAGRELEVDVTMDPKVSEDVAAETIRRYNQFLESVTGFSSKERAKRLRKSPGGSSSGD